MIIKDLCKFYGVYMTCHRFHRHRFVDCVPWLGVALNIDKSRCTKDLILIAL